MILSAGCAIIPNHDTQVRVKIVNKLGGTIAARCLELALYVAAGKQVSSSYMNASHACFTFPDDAKLVHDSEVGNEDDMYVVHVGSRWSVRVPAAKMTTRREMDDFMQDFEAIKTEVADLLQETARFATVRCSGCGGVDVLSNTVQTRSGDEASTVFYTCMGCGKQIGRAHV